MGLLEKVKESGKIPIKNDPAPSRVAITSKLKNPDIVPHGSRYGYLTV